METKANYTLIGVFTVAGFLGILVFLLWLARMDLNRRVAFYDIYFPEVSGLGTASEVRLAGLPVGRVTEMELVRDQVMPVRVRVELAEGTPVRSDSAAILEVQGVTGLAVVSISAGSPDAPLLREVTTGEVPVIASARSALQTLTDSGPQILDRLNRVTNELDRIFNEENGRRVASILSNVDRASENLDQAFEDLADAASAISAAGAAATSLTARADGLAESADTTLERLSEAASAARESFEAVESAAGSIDSYFADDLAALTARLADGAQGVTDLSERANATLDNVESAVASARRAFDAAETVLGNDIPGAARDLRETLNVLNRAFAALPEEIPKISAGLSEAAGNAASAFRSLRELLDGTGPSVRGFARDTLPQVSRLAQEMRGLVDNANRLVSALRRNPSQLLSPPAVPEFRR